MSVLIIVIISVIIILIMSVLIIIWLLQEWVRVSKSNSKSTNNIINHIAAQLIIVI